MKTVLITGSSAGIGKETAYVYAENKYNLVLVARRRESMEQMKADIENKHSVKVEIIDLDLSQQNSADELYDRVNDKNLKIDVLINNAGFGIKGNFVDIDIKREESMLMLNIITLTKLTKLFIKDMVKLKRGHVINIASTGAYQAVPGMSEYAATKAYVLSFSEGVALELKGTGVNVTVISPGATESEFAETAGFKKATSFNNAPTSRDLAEFIYKSMIKKKVSAMHGFKNKALMFGSKFMSRTFVAKTAGKIIGE